VNCLEGNILVINVLLTVWIPAFAGMTALGNGAARSGNWPYRTLDQVRDDGQEKGILDKGKEVHPPRSPSPQGRGNKRGMTDRRKAY